MADSSSSKGSLAELTPDPENARRHPARNREVVEASLRRVGAARSIVVDEDGLILAGNATVDAAKVIGIERVRFVETDGTELIAVRRTNLSPEEKEDLKLYDNRSSELAEWETETLAAIFARRPETADIFGGREALEALIYGDEPEPPEDFASVDSDLETEHTCPKCGYSWSGG
jgi:hypothetical protein